jgi:hypothetical protein
VGLFGGNAAASQHPELVGLLVTADKSRKQDMKMLAANEQAIAQILVASGERAIVIAADWNSMSGGVLLVTDRRSVTIRKGKLGKQLMHDEVHSTWLGTQANGSMLVEIRSKKAMLDYSPNDADRYLHIIQSSVGTPRAGQMICGAIDSRI